MALSNAERQARYLQRLKDKAAAGGDGPLVSQLREAYQAQKREIEEDADIIGFEGEYTPAHFLIDVVEGEAPEVGYSALKPVFCALFDLPDDPWPGLTADDLVRMTKGRTKEARDRGIRTYSSGFELHWHEKLRAWMHRDWLERR
jgi:hypothetical protein